MNYDTAFSGSSSRLQPSIRKTLSNTFLTVGGMMLVTAFSSYLSFDLKLGGWALLGVFAASFGALFAAMAFRESAFGLVLVAVFAGIQGVTLGPVLSHYLALKNGVGIVGGAAGLTAVATFACAAYAVTTKRDFSQWRAFLFGATLALLVVMLVAMFFPVPALHLVISAAAAVLFTAWLLFDIGAIVNGQETNYISAAINVYLDILNIFLHLMNIFGLSGGDD